MATKHVLEIYQAVIRYRAIATVVQESPLTDVRVLRLIDALLRKGVFEVTASAERMDQTYDELVRPESMRQHG